MVEKVVDKIKLEGQGRGLALMQRWDPQIARISMASAQISKISGN